MHSIGREIVDLDSDAWGNKVLTTGRPMRIVCSDCILMTPMSIYV